MSHIISFVMSTSIHVNNLNNTEQFFIGIKNQCLLLNKNKIKIQLKSIGNCINIIAKRHKKILFLSQNENYKKEIQAFALKKNQLYSEWKPGLFSNYNYTKTSYKFKNKLRGKPNLVLILDDKISETLLSELRVINLPVICLSLALETTPFVSYSFISDFSKITIEPVLSYLATCLKVKKKSNAPKLNFKLKKRLIIRARKRKQLKKWIK